MEDKPVFHVGVTIQGTVTVIKPIGWLIASNREGLESRLEATLIRGCTRMVMDLSSIHFADNCYLTILPAWKRKLDEAGGCFILASPSGAALRGLFAGHLNKALPICDTVAEAIELAKQRTTSGRWKLVTT